MSNEIPSKKVERLQKKVAKLTEKLILEIQGICENMDYHNSSNFSYNIDRIKQFNEGLQSFKPHNKDND